MPKHPEITIKITQPIDNTRLVLQCLDTVSYTHLDVYKRQHKNNALHCVQRLCAITQKTDNIQKAFYERLIEDINSLKTSPDAGLSEVYTVKNILHE